MPLLAVWLEMHCPTRAVSVPLLAVRLMYCPNRTVLVPLFAVRLEMYCPNRAILVPLLAVRRENALPQPRCCGAPCGCAARIVLCNFETA